MSEHTRATLARIATAPVEQLAAFLRERNIEVSSRPRTEDLRKSAYTWVEANMPTPTPDPRLSPCSPRQEGLSPHVGEQIAQQLLAERAASRASHEEGRSSRGPPSRGGTPLAQSGQGQPGAPWAPAGSPPLGGPALGAPSRGGAGAILMGAGPGHKRPASRSPGLSGGESGGEEDEEVARFGSRLPSHQHDFGCNPKQFFAGAPRQVNSWPRPGASTHSRLVQQSQQPDRVSSPRDERTRGEDVPRGPLPFAGFQPVTGRVVGSPALLHSPVAQRNLPSLEQQHVDLEWARLYEEREARKESLEEQRKMRIEQRHLREVQEKLLQLQLDAAARPVDTARAVVPEDQSHGRGSTSSLLKFKGHLLEPWREGEDLLDYLELYENLCDAADIPEGAKGVNLIGLLSGKAKHALLGAPAGTLKDYTKVRALLHESLDFTPDMFRVAFRSQVRSDYDSYPAMMRYWSRTWDYWMDLEQATTVSQVKDVCLREVLGKAAPDALKIALLDEGRLTAEEAAQKAHLWERNRSRVKAESAQTKNAGHVKTVVRSGEGGNCNNNASVPSSQKSSAQKDTTKVATSNGSRAPPTTGKTAPVSGKAGNQAPVKGGVNNSGKGVPNRPQGGKPPAGYSCYACGSVDHYKADCPALRAKTNSAERVNSIAESDDSGVREHIASIAQRSKGEESLHPLLQREVVDLSLNGAPIRALPDSGASITCVREEGVLPDQLTGEVVQVDYADGHQGEVPLARVHLSWEGDEGPDGFLRRVGVCKTQKLDCYLGMDYLKEMRSAMTRAQSKKLAMAQPNGSLPSEPASPGEAIEPPCELPGRGEPITAVLDWGGALPAAEVVVASADEPEEVDPMALWTPGTLELHNPSAFREALGADSSLAQLRAGAFPQRPKEEELRVPKPRYIVYWDGGLLYSEPTTHSLTGPGRRLVVPLPYRGELLRLGHEIPTAGHLGLTKTRARVLNNFYWPTMTVDIQTFVKTCTVCQVTGKSGGQTKAPLVPLPIVGTPFQRVGMDLVGPITPASSSGKQYILVVVDYATRYPEAVALRSTSAPAVAEALMGIFSRVGFPDEVISDRGPQFVSAVMHSLWHISGVQHRPSTSYHPETNGLCERFNGTLKSMLLAFTEQHGRKWEKYLPYLLFAYREVPQESTGFSPFELLYGWRVKGPLQLVRDAWEGKHVQEGQAIVPYVLNLREKLRECLELSTENLANAQRKQKQWYDRQARVSSYTEGQEVLLLVPVKQNKMLAAWTGPHKVVQKLSEVNYVIERADKPGAHSTYHVNMMKPFYRRTEFSMAICEPDTLSEEEACIPNLLEESQGSSVLDAEQLSDELSAQQKEELLQVLAPFRTTFSSLPGVVKGVMHDVDTGDAVPIRTSPYKVSPAVGASIRKEVREMLELGVIEASTSEWASPIVLVQKKDLSTRFCTDYRRLNLVTKSDAHPLPRIDDLLDKLGPSKFITTFDLTKGYWQVQLTERAKERSAFTCPEGLFQYRVMPFGMKNAPATFQRLINSVLRGLELFALAYLDDIAIFSQDWKSHLSHVSAVLTRLQECGLTVKVQKCQFAQGEVDYLGHCVGKGRLRPLEAKVEAIRDWPTPSTQRQVRAFLGTAGYYRSFVPAYSTISAPLTDLLVKKAPKRVIWTQECQNAFDTLKRILCQEPVLLSPDPAKTFYVQTDASDVGIGAVLSQQYEGERDRPVVYLSRKLLPREQRWSVAERECLAVVWALKKLQPYLYGASFIVQTDHNPLTFLHSVGDASGKLLRWSLALQNYQFSVQYRSGAKNGNADGLSRMTFADAA